MKNITPNRVAAGLTWLAGLGAAVYGVAGSLPEKWQPPVLIVAGLLTKTVVANKYLEGSQKWDALEHWAESADPAAVPIPAALPVVAVAAPAAADPAPVVVPAHDQSPESAWDQHAADNPEVAATVAADE